MRRSVLSLVALLGLLVGSVPGQESNPGVKARVVPRQTRAWPPSIAGLDTRVHRAITDMFLGYERRSSGSLRRLLSGGFRSRDALGFGHGQPQMAMSIDGDFRSLRDIRFDADVHPPEYSADYRQARVDIQFQRTCRFSASGEEWIVRNQRSTLLIDLAGRLTRLAAIDGDPLFGLTNPMGVLIVDRGTIDGRTVLVRHSVVNGRLGSGTQDLLSYGSPRRFGTTALPGALLPDLAVASADLRFAPDPPSIRGGTFTVTVIVRNLGPAPAAAFQLRATATANPPRTQVVGGLAAGASTIVVLAGFVTPGPAGSAGTVQVTADPASLIQESNRSDNTGTRGFVSVP